MAILNFYIIISLHFARISPDIYPTKAKLVILGDFTISHTNYQIAYIQSMKPYLQYRGLESEMDFETSRSSGPGGQNVNKTNSRVTLRFNIPSSVLLDEQEKEILQQKLSLTTEGDLLISSQESRSQLNNKENCKEKFYETLMQAFKKKKVRKVTRPTKASQRRRLDDKKKQGEKKKWRGGIDF